MNRFVLLLMLLSLPCMLLADESSTQPREQCQSGDCRDCKCDHCGCQAHCQKVCHVVCEWKDVKETVYACRCTDICIPGHSEKECTKIDECNPNNCPLLHDYKPWYSLWNPSDCVRIRPVTKLVKIEVTHKVPTYKWVVEYCCDNCRCELTQDESSANAQAASQQRPSDERQCRSEKPAAGAPRPDAVQQVGNVELANFESQAGGTSLPNLPACFETPLQPTQPQLLPVSSAK